MKRLVILGAGGYAKTVADMAEQLNYEVVAMLDDKHPGFELSTFSSYINDIAIAFIPAFGNNEFRLSWCKRIQEAGATLATLIHPTAYISPKAFIEPGTVILPHAIINTGTKVKRGCIINLGAIVDHDCVIEEGVHICLGAIVKGENRIQSCTKIEAGQVIERSTYH